MANDKEQGDRQTRRQYDQKWVLFILEHLLEQFRKGKASDAVTFKKTIYEKLAAAVNKEFDIQPPLTWSQLKNHWTNTKTKWTAYCIYRRDKSGWGVDNAGNYANTEEIEEAYFAAHPKQAAAYREGPPPNSYILEEMLGTKTNGTERTGRKHPLDDLADLEEAEDAAKRAKSAAELISNESEHEDDDDNLFIIDNPVSTMRPPARPQSPSTLTVTHTPTGTQTHTEASSARSSTRRSHTAKETASLKLLYDNKLNWERGTVAIEDIAIAAKRPPPTALRTAIRLLLGGPWSVGLEHTRLLQLINKLELHPSWCEVIISLEDHPDLLETWLKNNLLLDHNNHDLHTSRLDTPSTTTPSPAPQALFHTYNEFLGGLDIIQDGI